MKQEMGKPPLMRKTDLIVIALLAGIALVLLLLFQSGKAAAKAEIYKDGALITTVALDMDKTFTLPAIQGMEFEIKSHAIRIAKSDCHDQICVQSGFLRTPWQTAVCLPNRVVVKLVGESGGVDIVVG